MLDSRVGKKMTFFGSDTKTHVTSFLFRSRPKQNILGPSTHRELSIADVFCEIYVHLGSPRWQRVCRARLGGSPSVQNQSIFVKKAIHPYDFLKPN